MITEPENDQEFDRLVLRRSILSFALIVLLLSAGYLAWEYLSSKSQDKEGGVQIKQQKQTGLDAQNMVISVL